MEPQRRAFVLVVLTVLVVLAVTVGTIVYLNKQFQKGNRVVLESPHPQTSSLPTGSSPATGSQLGVGVKTYTGTNFKLHYPQNWGLLTCSNSQNFELDPVNSSDSLGVVCNFAQKSITVLVSPSFSNCQGNSTNIATVAVIKSKTTTEGETDYRWCTKQPPFLDITHRVSPNPPSGAYSKEDYSDQIEQLISSLSPDSGF